MEWSDYEECNLCKTSQSRKIFSALGEGGGRIGGGVGGGGRVALLGSYDIPYGEAPSERGTFFRLQVYQKVDNSRVEK